MGLYKRIYERLEDEERRKRVKPVKEQTIEEKEDLRKIRRFLKNN